MLELHRAERADHLVEALAGVLAVPPQDPFAADVVAVPSRGVERWLAQRLSHRLGSGPGREDGVCAQVEFPSPAELVAAALAGATGILRDEDPWHPRRLPWPLLRVIDECAGEPWCAVLTAHLSRGGRRFATAQRLAVLFDAYGAYRPAMIEAWAAGRDEDGLGEPLRPSVRWQAEVWRRLRSALGEVPAPAERLAAACARLRADGTVADLPERLSLFGPTRLAAADLAVLAALAEHRDVHLWLPHPSPALWQRVAPETPSRPVRRAEDPTAALPRHPLLGSLARDARELQLRLAATGAPARHTHHPGHELPSTLLGRLQQSLRDDVAPGGTPFELAAEDRSLVVHACHGPDRQVEVLRDALLGLLAEDPTLEPRDVLVMCPDIETFAPLISASFGLGREAGTEGEPSHPAHRLRVRLADRALREVNPLLGVVASVLELADARATAAQLVDLLAGPPVHTRLGLDEDDLDRLRELVRRAEIRWGLDADHRGPYQLGSFPQNTWSAGLERMLLGVAMPEEGHWIGTALPLDDVDSGDVALVGRLAEFADRVRSVVDDLEGEHPPAHWTAALTRALDLLTLVPTRDAWQDTQARAVLAEIETGAAGRDTPLTRTDVRSVLGDRLKGRPTRANFRTGTLTMCTMVPMRSVPHRVVCLLGIDDGVFPRTAGTDGDDVLALDPCTGERDPRSEDRQLLLDAILAAGEHLLVVYSGRDERTNARRPPAVPVAELLDTVDALAAAAAGRPAREQVLVEHPLQPFDPENFTRNGLGAVGRPFSFDRAALAGASRAAEHRSPPPPLLLGPLPPAPEAGEVALDELIAFVEHPVKAFLRQRVGISTYREEDAFEDGLPIEPDALAQWAIGDRLLRDRLRGASVEDCAAAEWRRGALPPGPLGGRLLRDLLRDVEPLVAEGSGWLAAAERSAADIDVELPGGDRVTGTVAGVHGPALVEVVWSRLGPKHRLRAWVRLLALSAAGAGEDLTAVTVGRSKGSRVLRSTLGPVEPDRARELLADLVALRRDGLREPLPMPCKAIHAYADHRIGGGSVDEALEQAEREWSGRFGEGLDDLAHDLCWGPRARLEVLTAAPAVAPGTAPAAVALATDPSRFGALAMRLWEPLLALENLGSV